MKVIEFAEHRLKEEQEEKRLGADNNGLINYWSAYLDGARAQKIETNSIQDFAITKMMDETKGLCLCISDFAKKMTDLVNMTNEQA